MYVSVSKEQWIKS